MGKVGYSAEHAFFSCSCLIKVAPNFSLNYYFVCVFSFIFVFIVVVTLEDNVTDSIFKDSKVVLHFDFTYVLRMAWNI